MIALCRRQSKHTRRPHFKFSQQSTLYYCTVQQNIRCFAPSNCTLLFCVYFACHFCVQIDTAKHRSVKGKKNNERRNERTKDSRKDRKRDGGKGIKKESELEARDKGQGLKGRHNRRQKKEKKIGRMKIQRAARRQVQLCALSVRMLHLSPQNKRGTVHAVMGNNRLMTSQHSECPCYRARRWLADWPAISKYLSLFRYSQSSLGSLHNGHCSRRRADNEQRTGLFLGASGTTPSVGNSSVGCRRHAYREELDMERNLVIRIGKIFQHLQYVLKQTALCHKSITKCEWVISRYCIKYVMWCRTMITN